MAEVVGSSAGNAAVAGSSAGPEAPVKPSRTPSAKAFQTLIARYAFVVPHGVSAPTDAPPKAHRVAYVSAARPDC